MIKVGDKVEIKKIGVIKTDIVTDVLKLTDDGFFVFDEKIQKFRYCPSRFTKYNVLRNAIDYKSLYEQQKQRADELEKSLNLSIIASGNDTLVKELQKALSESNERADQLEKRWGKLKETLLRYENIPQRIQSFETVLALMNEMERIELEDNND